MSDHPYIDKTFLKMPSIEKRILNKVNKGRTYRGEAVTTTYYLTSKIRKGEPLFSGIEHAIDMMLIHGTVEVWPGPGKEPSGYRKHMSWLKEVKFLTRTSRIESAMIKIATPLDFFDKTKLPLAQIRMAAETEPFNAFIDFTARVVDYDFSLKLKKKFLGQVWPHKRVREYLKVGHNEPIIGTIVKPKWLPPKLFAESVTRAALGGALFIKSDENLHLSKKEVAIYVKETVNMLKQNGFDLSRNPKRDKKRMLFAPHLTTNPQEILEYAKVAVDSGANALMFSPHFAGDFGIIQEIYRMGDKYKVPIYAHTAGMNKSCGDPEYRCGEDSRAVYFLAALSGAAFMQLTGMGSYLRPVDCEKKPIIEKLKREGLEGDNGMTLVIAGGLGPKNIGYNIKMLGARGRMFLAGQSIFHHPGGVESGIQALKLAVEAASRGIYEGPRLKRFAQSLGEKGYPLLRAL